MANIAVFMDRDDTIIQDVPYCSSRDDVRLMNGAAEGIRKLNDSGIRVIVITNQSGIGRGYFTVEQMEEVNMEMERQLAVDGAHIDALFFCPHKPEDGCACRKPATGLIDAARNKLHTENEFVIGDRDDIDGELARRAGLKYALVGERTLLEVVEEYLNGMQNGNY